MSGRNGAAQEDGEFSVGDARDVGAQVVTEGRVDWRGCGSFDLKGGAQRRVLHIVADVDRPGSGLGLPRAARGLPVAESVAIEGDGNAHRPTCGNLNLCESFELAGGAEHAAGGTHVELDDVSAVSLGRIGDREGRALLVHLEVGVLEARVRQSVAKGEGNVDARGREVSVADEGAFAIVGQRAGRRVPGGGRMVLVGTRVGLSESSRGVHGAGEDVQHRRGPALTTQVAVDQRSHRFRPGNLDAGATGQDDHGARIGCNDGLDETILPLGQAHVRPIQPLGFGEFIKPHVDEGDVSARGEGHGLGNEGVVRSPMTVITAGVPGQDEASRSLSPGLKQLARSLDARRIDLGGTRSLETRRVSKVADERNTRARTQR